MTTQNIILFIVVLALTLLATNFMAALYWRGCTERLGWKTEAMMAGRTYASLKSKR